MIAGIALRNLPPGGKPGAAEPCAAAVFTLLWDALADVLGTAATATILRRAARRASQRCPQLVELVIERQNFDYGYTVPADWEQSSEGMPLALGELFGELRLLLAELTGSVILGHLENVPGLREHLVSPKEVPR